MSVELDVVIDGLDFTPLTERNDALTDLRGALELRTTPENAGALLRKLAAFILVRAGAPEMEQFDADVAEVNRLQVEVQRQYDASTAAGRPQPGFAERLRPLLERQADIFERLARYPDFDGIERNAANIDLARELEEAGGRAEDAPDEDRTTTTSERARAYPPRPRASVGREADVNRGLAALLGGRTGLAAVAARPVRSYATEQFRLLRDYDPIAASQGYEVRVTGNGIDIHIDGIEPLPDGTFNLLEAKYNDPAIDSVYTEGRGGGGGAEGSLRDEIGRLVNARDQLRPAGARKIVIVTNTEGSEAAIRALLAQMNFPDLDAAGIEVRLHPL